MIRHRLALAFLFAASVMSQASHSVASGNTPATESRRWLAGDHHVHSEFSVGWKRNPERPDEPPEPVLGGDAIYSIEHNAAMARRYSLDWMVSTDHGGPQHSRVNAQMAYPELLRARQAVSDLVLFYGMEFDTPGGEHSTLIIPTTPEERAQLQAIEAKFSERDAFPADPARDTKPKMLDALRFMANQTMPPVLIANHPSRTATGLGRWGRHDPSEFAEWQDAAPEVAIGMEGAPGHQAAGPTPARPSGQNIFRGIYEKSPTLGGFDQMTAVLGGAWDALLGQGRRWWITATSDSHRNWRDGGADFWPGEYAKTWVFARKDPADILDGLRNGRIFVTTGDLITELDVTVSAAGIGRKTAGIGGSLPVSKGRDVDVVIRFRPATKPNGGGSVPRVDHVDLVIGQVVSNPASSLPDRNPTTQVVRRFELKDRRQDLGIVELRHRVRNVSAPIYLRVRGTNTTEHEPKPDTVGENPWADLWFYSNPIFIKPH